MVQIHPDKITDNSTPDATKNAEPAAEPAIDCWAGDLFA
jgi:hypothetical protein